MTKENQIPSNDFYKEWNESYARFENSLFFPSEAVIRFVNRHIRRRIGVNSYTRCFSEPPLVLEIGSGAGRHMAFFAKEGLRPTGIELSSVACDQAHALLANEGISTDAYEIINCSAEKIPVDSNSFDYAVSVSTLDSMPTRVTRQAVAEIHRALKPDGLFFADLMSDEAMRPGAVNYTGDQLVDDRHEHGTIQSYFNMNKINNLFLKFEIREIYKILTASHDNTITNARYYITCNKIK